MFALPFPQSCHGEEEDEDEVKSFEVWMLNAFPGPYFPILSFLLGQ